MATKNINARIKNKRDTSANWTANDPVLLSGEIILVDTNSGELRAKVGDGKKKYSELPFTDEVLRTLVDTKANDAKKYTDEQIANLTSGDYTISKAEHATTADTATNATHAVNADTATKANTADSATKATKDGSGNTITTTYETKSDASAKLTEAKGYTDEKIDEISETVVDLSDSVSANYNESIIGLSVDGQTVTYIKGDGTTHSFTTQDTNTTYSLGTDTVTGLTKLYATTGSAEDGTMTQKAIKTELDKKVGVTIDNTSNTLVFTI